MEDKASRTTPMTRGEATFLAVILVVPAGIAAFFGLVFLLDKPTAGAGGGEGLAAGVAVGALIGILVATAKFSDWLFRRFGPKEEKPT